MDSTVNVILRGVALAMGVAVTVLSAMDVIDLGSGMTMLGIGLACLSLSLFPGKGK